MLMPQGIDVANVTIDGAIGWTRSDGSHRHGLAGDARGDSTLVPGRIADTCLQLHREHRSTWAFEIVLRRWVERWKGSSLRIPNPRLAKPPAAGDEVYG